MVPIFSGDIQKTSSCVEKAKDEEKGRISFVLFSLSASGYLSALSIKGIPFPHKWVFG